MLNDPEPVLADRVHLVIVEACPLSSLLDLFLHLLQVLIRVLVVNLLKVKLDQDPAEERKVVRSLKADHASERVVWLGLGRALIELVELHQLWDAYQHFEDL